MKNLFHFYRYHRNFAIGIGIEQTFTGYWAFRLGLGFWCFSITVKPWR
jgi:hypothetical protein